MGSTPSKSTTPNPPQSTGGTDIRTDALSSPQSVEIEINQIDGTTLKAQVIPGETTGVQIGEQLKIDAEGGEWFLLSDLGDKIGMTQDTAKITQEMINASKEGKWSVIRVGITVRVLAGKEKGSVEDYRPDAPTCLIVPGTNLKTTLIPKLMRTGAEMGKHTDEDMGEGKPTTKWPDAYKVRLFNDMLWPDRNIVCVVVANFPHPRAYSEYPDLCQPFTRDRAEEYFDRYRLAMDAVDKYCPRADEVEQFATVPFGTQMGHTKEEDIPYLLERLLPALRKHLCRGKKPKHLDFLSWEEKWVENLKGADETDAD